MIFVAHSNATECRYMAQEPSWRGGGQTSNTPGLARSVPSTGPEQVNPRRAGEGMLRPPPQVFADI